MAVLDRIVGAFKKVFASGGQNNKGDKQYKFLDKENARVARLGMSPRQLYLNRLMSFYGCLQYEGRKYDWNGNLNSDAVEKEAIATAGVVPPGFVDVGGQSLPLQFRKPTAPYHLCRSIVHRFTGLLFSESKHPKFRVQGEPETEKFLTALADSTRLFAKFAQARNLGGAQGAVGIGFRIVNGKIILDIHDPRWCFPSFKDFDQKELEALEIRWMIPKEEERRNEKGEWVWVTVWYWKRRLITEEADITYNEIEVTDEEPKWEGNEKEKVEHNLGFCPVIWIQNVPVLDAIDGEPDCHGVYDDLEAIDRLIAQAVRGTVANIDPTLVLSTTDAFESIRKGSDNAIKLTNGSASYLEITGAGMQAAGEWVDRLRKFILEVVQCVLDQPETSGKTATEVRRQYASMIERADLLREQYGQVGILPLVQMILKAIRQGTEPRIDEDGNTILGVVKMPKDSGTIPDEDDTITLQWPGYFELSPADATQMAAAAASAKEAGLLDAEHASRYVAEAFNVEDVPKMLANAKKEAEEAQKQAMAMETAAQGGGAAPPDKPEKKEALGAKPAKTNPLADVTA